MLTSRLRCVASCFIRSFEFCIRLLDFGVSHSRCVVSCCVASSAGCIVLHLLGWLVFGWWKLGFALRFGVGQHSKARQGEAGTWINDWTNWEFE